MIPYGGMSLENMEQWYKSGAYAIGIGNALTKGTQKPLRYDYSSNTCICRKIKFSAFELND